MFKFIKMLTKSKNENSKRYRMDMAKHLDGRHIKYVTERFEDIDNVIGRDGALIIKGEQFLVYSSSDVVFRADISVLKASELLSLEGVILSAPDIEHDGKERTIIAYYTYYLKTKS